MDKKKCIITGSNGYLGKQLSIIFKKYGWQVVELSSSNKDDQFNFNLKNLENFKYNVLEKCNLLIHTAYDFSANSLEKSISTNVNGSEKLFYFAKKMNVEKIIHISSLSSFNKAKSIYGKTKIEIENVSKKYGVINLRAGLFFGGDSKLIEKISNICKKIPIIPLIGNGNFKLHLCHYEDLSNFIINIYNDKNCDLSKIYYCCSKTSITFKQLIKKISNNKLTIPIPVYFIIIILKIIEIMKIKLPLNLDNLYGLILYNDEIEFEHSDKYKILFRTL